MAGMGHPAATGHTVGTEYGTTSAGTTSDSSLRHCLWLSLGRAVRPIPTTSCSTVTSTGRRRPRAREQPDRRCMALHTAETFSAEIGQGARTRSSRPHSWGSLTNEASPSAPDSAPRSSLRHKHIQRPLACEHSRGSRSAIGLLTLRQTVDLERLAPSSPTRRILTRLPGRVSRPDCTSRPDRRNILLTVAAGRGAERLF